MTIRKRLFVAIVVLLTAAVLLSACSTGEGADPGDKQTPTPTATTSTTPAPPPGLPDAATNKTVDGGVAFVSYYYKLVEYGHLTEKWEPLRDLTDDSCEVCQQFWSGPELFGQNEDVVSEIGTPNSRGIQDGKLEVTIVMDVGAGISSANSETAKFERTAKRWQDDVTIVYKDGWRVVGIEPDQLRPYESCIADRCTDAQRERAKGEGQ